MNHIKYLNLFCLLSDSAIKFLRKFQFNSALILGSKDCTYIYYKRDSRTIKYSICDIPVAIKRD